MNIGFDLDRVLINNPPGIPDKIIDMLDKARTNSHLLYRIPSKPEQLLRRLTYFNPLRSAIKKNIIFVEDIARRNGNKHYLISGRFKFLEKTTKAFAKKHKFDTIFDAMFFNFNNEQPHIFKDRIVKKLQLDKYIDDDLDLLKYLAKENMKTTFFWFNHKLHKQINTNLFAITDLEDIFQ